MSGGSDIPITPNQHRGEGSQKRNRRPDIPSGDFSPLKKQRPDDQTERNRPSKIIRVCNLLIGPKDFGYAKRVLTPAEVDLPNPVLRISNDYQHFVFLNNHSLVENPDFTGSIPYRVYGKSRNVRQYNMKLSRAKIFGSMHVSLSEWDTIVRGCGLRAGDEVWFHKCLNTGISDDFLYTFNRVRKAPSDEGKNVYEGLKEAMYKTKADKGSSARKPVLKLVYNRLPLDEIPDQRDGNTVQGPGSRYFPHEAHCITKTLTWYNVAPGTGKLLLSATDAVILTDNPRIPLLLADGNYEKDIQVFDVENHEYTMTVSAHYSEGRGIFYYCLVGDQWIDFVTRHNLEQGDELMIYKFLDSTFSSRYYHVLRYVSKNAQKMNITDGSGSSDRCFS